MTDIGATDIESDLEKIGVWPISLPAPKVYFQHSIAYLVETGGRPLLIDTGEASESAWRALEAGVARAGYAMTDIGAVLLTHGHYDHCGSAERIRVLSGAWIGLSPAEEDFLRRHPSDSTTRQKVRALCVRAGVDPAELPPLAEDEPPEQPVSIAPDMRLTDGQRFAIGERTIEVVMTPGHSPGHAAFLLAREGLLFGGDHLFPRGGTVVMLLDVDTPRGAPPDDPLGAYLASLARVERREIRLVLPGHIGPFANLAERVEDERRRCLRRLDEFRAGIGDMPATPAAIAARMRWGKGSWTELAPAVRQMAILNTVTALRALEVRGEARRTDSGDRLLYRNVSNTAREVA